MILPRRTTSAARIPCSNRRRRRRARQVCECHSSSSRRLGFPRDIGAEGSPLIRASAESAHHYVLLSKDLFQVGSEVRAHGFILSHGPGINLTHSLRST